MDTTRWNRLRALYEAAVALPAAERGPYLDEACDDPGLRDEVGEMVGVGLTTSLRIDDKLLRDERPDPAGETAQPGSQLGDYVIVRHLGRGGFADVYLAESPGQAVALKVLRAGSFTAETAQRLRLEEEILAGLDHPGIAGVLGSGSTDDGRPFIVMEFVDGLPLIEFAKEERVDLPGRLGLFVAVCEAVAFAHRSGVIHRDLKPAHVLVKDDGQPVLLDFGIAKVLAPAPGRTQIETPAGVRLLTPTNAAPEQLAGAPPTVQTEVYGLGLLLYELLAGRPALDPSDKNWLEWERVVAEEVPPPPSEVAIGWAGMSQAELRSALRGPLDGIVGKALAKDPSLRHPAVETLAAEINDWLGL